MKFKLIYLLPVLFAFVLSSCSGGGVGTASSWSGLSADAETAYLAINQHVYAINLSNGLEKWRFPTEGKTQISYYAPPAITPDGQLLVGDYVKSLHSLNINNGQENWVFSEATDRYIGGPLVEGERIYAPNAGHQVFALDLRGNLIWTFKTGGPVWATPITDPNCDCIYVASMDHRLYAIEKITGNQKWVSEQFGGSIVGTPALSEDGILYVGTFASEILAVNAQDGSVVWRTSTDGWIWGGPQLIGDRLYFGDLKGNLYAVDARSGEIIWRTPLGSNITGSPLVTEDMIYIGTENGVLNALDLNGNGVWNKPFNGKLYTSPVKAGDLILVAPIGTDELLFALDKNGNQKWSFIPEKK